MRPAERVAITIYTIVIITMLLAWLYITLDVTR
jgi:hypothetical protein